MCYFQVLSKPKVIIEESKDSTEVSSFGFFFVFSLNLLVFEYHTTVMHWLFDKLFSEILIYLGGLSNFLEESNDVYNEITKNKFYF